MSDSTLENLPEIDSAQWEQWHRSLRHLLWVDRAKVAKKLKRLKQFQGKPEQQARQRVELKELLERCQQRFERRQQARPKLVYPQDLPIVQHREQIIQALKVHPLIVVSGQTGSGKTTQLPKLCLEAGFGVHGRIGCTQPRRIAALSIAARIAEECEVPLGDGVGYKIRFGDKTSELTTIKLMTDGILLTEINQSHKLLEYEVLIIDEAHERSLNIDFLLGYLKRLLEKRKDLKVIVTSASIEVERFSAFFNNAPVIEVQGRAYPVEVEYRPLDHDLEEAGEMSVVDLALAETLDVVKSSRVGNVLVFMPGEREISEMQQRLQGANPPARVLPLYSRLSQGEQSRVFQQPSQRKIIIATNIAETSLTLPNIHYVIDTGLARISRYSNRSRTQRLPVERISQSSAEQRKGRAGRVAPGKCIRLYAEDEYKQFRPYTEPEILRSNLSEVILLMKGLRLESIETFPFMDAPNVGAIREGVKLLKELGALDQQEELTRLGRRMATLPIEPRTAKMLLAASDEYALREVLAIAAGISVQDPREFPQDKKDAAHQKHAAYTHRDSDFLTLLNLWNHYHEQRDTLGSENRMRKHCKANFLSFIRMREWRDIHQQLCDILEENGLLKLNEQPADYRAIHVSVLAGYISQIAQKKQKNLYLAAGNKEVMLFPGSGLFNHGKNWIVAAEMVETSRLFARLAANVEAEWLEQAGGDLCRYSYSHPRFEPETSSVMADERVNLYGLTIVPRRKVPYGRVNPKEANEIFINEGLVYGLLEANIPFYRENLKLKQQVIEEGAKLRRGFEHEVEEALRRFYLDRLRNLGNLHDLNRLVKELIKRDELKVLFAEREDLLPTEFVPADEEEFPNEWQIGEETFELHYEFAPAKTSDGVTLQIPQTLLPVLKNPMLEWPVRGNLEAVVFNLIKGLPKRFRKQLVPASDSARKLAGSIPYRKGGFLQELSAHVERLYGVEIPLQEWKPLELPEYLQTRFAVYNSANQLIAEGRDIAKLMEECEHRLEKNQLATDAVKSLGIWQEARKHWDLSCLQSWNFEPMPACVELGLEKGMPVIAYPGLTHDDTGVHRTLFATREEAERETPLAVRAMIRRELGANFVFLAKDIKSLKEHRSAYGPFGDWNQLQQEAETCIDNWLFEGAAVRSAESYQQARDQVKQRLSQLWPEFADRFAALLNAHQAAVQQMLKYFKAPEKKPEFEMLGKHLDQVMPKHFLLEVPFSQWRVHPKRIKAVGVRAERLYTSPGKDAEKRELWEPWEDVWRQLSASEFPTVLQNEGKAQLHWMLEEYRVSLFAPELKSRQPVSPKRIVKFMQQVQLQEFIPEV